MMLKSETKVGRINIIDTGTNCQNHLNPVFGKDQNRLQDHSAQILLLRYMYRIYAKFLVYPETYEIVVELLQKTENAEIPYLNRSILRIWYNSFWDIPDTYNCTGDTNPDSIKKMIYTI